MSNRETHPHANRRKRGFEPASSLLSKSIRKAGETRGFAVSRVLTHWEDIVGQDTARIARPVDVRYGRQGFGATLTVLVAGAQAPMLEMQKETIREKVNACYGYAAISRIRLTQSSPVGFAAPQAAFQPAPKPQPSPETQQKSASLSRDVQDDTLRNALEKLGQNVLTKHKTARRP